MSTFKIIIKTTTTTIMVVVGSSVQPRIVGCHRIYVVLIFLHNTELGKTGIYVISICVSSK
jgi:hypothetical protein